MIRPDHVPSYNNLAKAYYLAELPELSVATYQEALRRDPSSAIASENLHLLSTAAPRRDEDVVWQPSIATSDSAAKAAVDTRVAQEELIPPLPAEDTEAQALRELLVDLPYVIVDRRAGQLTLTGWTRGPQERALLDKILGRPAPVAAQQPSEPAPGVAAQQPPNSAGQPSQVLDLTTDDTGDPDRMIEIDAVIFEVIQPEETQCGFDFLQLINFNFNYFNKNSQNPGTGYTAPAGQYGNLFPPVIGPLTGAVVEPLSQWSWITSAAANYNVNIANADIQRVAVLAQPHLTALSGSAATSLAGGELIYRTSGLNTGDIKIYPFGVTLNITPTLLRTPAEDGRPQVHVVVETGRSSVQTLLLNLDPNLPTPVVKHTVTTEAVVSIGQTLILTGLAQREQRTRLNGVPGLMSIPILKYLFSRTTTIENKSTLLILLTPRDPTYWGQQNLMAIQQFVEKRRAFIRARRGTDEDMQCFRELYPDWDQLPPNRFISHLFLAETSELYRAVTGAELTSEDIDLELLGPSGR